MISSPQTKKSLSLEELQNYSFQTPKQLSLDFFIQLDSIEKIGLYLHQAINCLQDQQEVFKSNGEDPYQQEMYQILTSLFAPEGREISNFESYQDQEVFNLELEVSLNSELPLEGKASQLGYNSERSMLKSANGLEIVNYQDLGNYSHVHLYPTNVSRYSQPEYFTSENTKSSTIIRPYSGQQKVSEVVTKATQTRRISHVVNNQGQLISQVEDVTVTDIIDTKSYNNQLETKTTTTTSSSITKVQGSQKLALELHSKAKRKNHQPKLVATKRSNTTSSGLKFTIKSPKSDHSQTLEQEQILESIKSNNHAAQFAKQQEIYLEQLRAITNDADLRLSQSKPKECKSKQLFVLVDHELANNPVLGQPGLELSSASGVGEVGRNLLPVVHSQHGNLHSEKSRFTQDNYQLTLANKFTDNFTIDRTAGSDISFKQQRVLQLSPSLAPKEEIKPNPVNQQQLINLLQLQQELQGLPIADNHKSHLLSLLTPTIINQLQDYYTQGQIKSLEADKEHLALGYEQKGFRKQPSLEQELAQELPEYQQILSDHNNELVEQMSTYERQALAQQKLTSALAEAELLLENNHPSLATPQQLLLPPLEETKEDNLPKINKSVTRARELLKLTNPQIYGQVRNKLVNLSKKRRKKK